MRLGPHTNIWVCPFCKGQEGQPRKIERAYAHPVEASEADRGIAELIGLHMLHEHEGFHRTPIQGENDLRYLEECFYCAELKPCRKVEDRVGWIAPLCEDCERKARARKDDD